MNSVPRWDIYGRSQARILCYPNSEQYSSISMQEPYISMTHRHWGSLSYPALSPAHYQPTEETKEYKLNRKATTIYFEFRLNIDKIKLLGQETDLNRLDVHVLLQLGNFL